MDVNKLKYVVGKADKNEPAIIRFFGPVDSYTTQCFNEEFLWLQNCVQPSKIIVLINSDGGSIVYGMSTFSIIQSCPIEVDCVIEGIAASMGSVIWAAGDNLYMHDYSILMIHNPFIYDMDSDDESIKNMINAFKGQLETIYQKRFGLSKDEVKRIMDGEGEADGTYFNAKEAVKAGILPSNNILKTSKQVRDKVKNQIEGITSATSLRDIMASMTEELNENKLIEKLVAIHSQNEQNFQEHKIMENKENVSFGAVCAQLGFSNDVPVANVSNRITDLLKAESDLQEVKSQLSEMQIKYQGKEAEVKNIGDELAEVKASLQKYQDAEKAALEAEIDNTVQAAIEAGKIEESAKESWIAMANTNFEMVKATLASIPCREKISQEIANDIENISHVQDAMKTAEEKMAEKVEAVVGKIDFKTF
jgi:ATP-dependent protease ClpP protease subunit